MSALLLCGCIIADFFFRGKRVVDGERTPELVFQDGKCGWLLGL